LEENVEERYTAFEALNHPWIVGNCPAPDIQAALNTEEENDQEAEF
jgi:hypothetical protein